MLLMSSIPLVGPTQWRPVGDRKILGWCLISPVTKAHALHLDIAGEDTGGAKVRDYIDDTSSSMYGPVTFAGKLVLQSGGKEI
ncbi:hypothetical protein HPP92_028874 [Vanilla planifolia]|uniref:Uncharacterized protein n=1 Tax=Vanilla planifolia TaxID=51239 RepID=A0A835P4A7_VANPL|nr:hypothetical protein HPP92_028874 [Vanilla planifolia]KAG0446376.1 hypothetical protein HPP92_028863 [Vanilla planifolia]